MYPSNTTAATISKYMGNAVKVSEIWGGIIVNVKEHGAKGDGVTDDTVAIQNAIEHTQKEVGTLLFPEGIYLTSGITISKTVIIEGDFTLKAKNDRQPHVMEIKARCLFNCTMHIDGVRKALNGIVASNFARSSFDYIRVENCKIWGMMYLDSGNNNKVIIKSGHFGGNGSRVSVGYTQISYNTSAGTSDGFANIVLDTPQIDAALAHACYFAIHGVDRRVHRVRNVHSDTSMELNHLNIGDGNKDSVYLIIGGGMNITSHGDNGIGSLSNIDFFSNMGCGLHISSLYGHQINDMSAQGNSIGFGCYNYSIGMTFIKPYFESNWADWAVWNYIVGTITDAVIAVEKMQFLLAMGVNSGISFIPRQFKIIDADGISNFTGTQRPSSNAGSVTLYPGHTYSFNNTNAGSNFSIQNSAKYATMLSEFIEINVFSQNSATYNFSLVAAGETIEGGTTHGVKVRGRAVIKVYKNDTNWRVTVLRADPASSISNIPEFVGQIAVVSGQAYIAVAVSSTSDWKQITT